MEAVFLAYLFLLLEEEEQYDLEHDDDEEDLEFDQSPKPKIPSAISFYNRGPCPRPEICNNEPVITYPLLGIIPRDLYSAGHFKADKTFESTDLPQQSKRAQRYERRIAEKTKRNAQRIAKVFDDEKGSKKRRKKV